MVVILCDDYRDAEMAFRAWIAFLQTPPSDEISTVDKFSLRVETSDGQCYIFVDYRFKNVFEKKKVVFETVQDFFDWTGLDDPNSYRNEFRRKVEENETN